MKSVPFDRNALRLSASLLLAGQLLYILVTLLHPGGEANNHAAIFAAYAESNVWTAVHAAQFLSMAIFLAGLFALRFALDGETEPVKWAARFGGASSVATLALCGVVFAVDGVALKQAVNALAVAPQVEKAARFATAEAIRWLEWGIRSYDNFTLGFAVLSFALAVARTPGLPRPIGYLMGLSGLAYLLQGWVCASQGFSQMHTIAIVLAEVVNVVWMTWLLAAATRLRAPMRGRDLFCPRKMGARASMENSRLHGHIGGG